MLRLKLEYIPFGQESHTQQIGVIEIRNDSTGDKASGNYQARLIKLDEPETAQRTCSVKGFRRLEKDAWDLSLRVLKKLLKPTA